MAGPRTPRRSIARNTIDVDPDWIEGEGGDTKTPKLPSKMPPVPRARGVASKTIDVEPGWVSEDDVGDDAAPPSKKKAPPRPSPRDASKAPPRPSPRGRPPPIPRDE